jgi:hypothetical protein
MKHEECYLEGLIPPIVFATLPSADLGEFPKVVGFGRWQPDSSCDTPLGTYIDRRVDYPEKCQFRIRNDKSASRLECRIRRRFGRTGCYARFGVLIDAGETNVTDSPRFLWGAAGQRMHRSLPRQLAAAGNFPEWGVIHSELRRNARSDERYGDNTSTWSAFGWPTIDSELPSEDFKGLGGTVNSAGQFARRATGPISLVACVRGACPQVGPDAGQ